MTSGPITLKCLVCAHVWVPMQNLSAMPVHHAGALCAFSLCFRTVGTLPLASTDSLWTRPIGLRHEKYRRSRYTSRFYHDISAKVYAFLLAESSIYHVTPPICITMRLLFVSRHFCRSIRVRGRWDTPNSGHAKLSELQTHDRIRTAPFE